MKENLLGSTLSRLGEVASEAALPVYAGRQLADWIYRKGVTRFEEMSNIPRGAREMLAERYSIEFSPPVKTTESSDGTKKYLFAAGSGRFVEAAWIPEARSTAGERFLIRCAGSDLAAVVVPVPFYDPEGKRLKS